ncbi:chaplin [Streptomyces sp. NPDC055709]
MEIENPPHHEPEWSAAFSRHLRCKHARSGNTLQAPAHVPANLCGPTLGIINLLNPASDNACAN